MLKLDEVNYSFKSVDNDSLLVFYNEDFNNLLVFRPTYEKCPIYKIYGYTSQIKYRYLVSLLNKNKNLIVEWSQIEGTASDLFIYHGLNPQELLNRNYKEILQELRRYIPQDCVYKYAEFKEGKILPISTSSV